MKLKQKAALAAAMLSLAATGAMAAESADLQVTGTIRPSACNISLNNGGVVTYGTISGQTLSETENTALPRRTMSLTISCDAATQVAYRVADGRPGTASSPAWDRMGLGAVEGSNIGYLRMGAWTPTLDGVSGVPLQSETTGRSWARLVGGYYVPPGASRYNSFALADETTPGAYSNISVPLQIEAYIAPKNDLPSLVGGVELDGLVTFELIYL